MRVRRIITVLFLLGISFTGSEAFAQSARTAAADREQGNPLVEYFDLKTVDIKGWNWCFAMESTGLLNIGSTLGIVQFDGRSWFTIPSPYQTPVFSMAMSPTDTLFFGLYGEFGRVCYDSLGDPFMDLLSDRLPDTAPAFTYVYGTHILDGITWFRSVEALFSWDGRELRYITSEQRLRQSHVFRGKLYVLVDEVGLCIVENHKLVLVPGGEQLANPDESLYWIIPYGEQKALLGTKSQGVLLYDGTACHEAWKYEDKLGIDVPPMTGVPLFDGSIALGTEEYGIWVVDSTGKVLEVINNAVGLGDNAVNGLMTDENQNLWVALEKGIARIEIPSPFSRFDKKTGLEGSIEKITRFKGQLYVATSKGLAVLVPVRSARGENDRPIAHFELLKDSPPQCIDLLPQKNELLVASVLGVYGYRPGSGFKRHSTSGCTGLLRLKHTNDTIGVANQSGVHFLARNGQGWKQLPRREEHTVFALNMAQAGDGTIWTGCYADGVLHIDISKGILQSRTVRYDSTHGLNQIDPISVSIIDGRPLFNALGGVFAFDPIRERFYPDTLFWKNFGEPLPNEPEYLFQDRFDQIWMRLVDSKEFGRVYVDEKHQYHFEYFPYSRLAGESFNCMYTDDDGKLWFGTETDVFRYDPAVRKNYKKPFSTLVRSIVLDRQVVRSGLQLGTKNMPIEIDHKVFVVVFQIANTYYSERDRTRYRAWLEGIETGWSEFRSRSSVEYSNLPYGEYTFHVQAINAEGVLGEEAVVCFNVSPPWYASWWAFVLYIVILIALVLVWRLWYRSRFLSARSRELELTVRERTMESESQAKEIRRQADELERMDSIVRAVNRETKLQSVLDALLMHSLLFFPHADMALFVRRQKASDQFDVVAAAGRRAFEMKGQTFGLRELIGGPEASMQRMQKGVYLFSGLGKRFGTITERSSEGSTRFMAMTVERARFLEGFLVLGSRSDESFSTADLHRLLRLKEHASSAVAKAGAIKDLEDKNSELDVSNRQLLATQQQLVSHEKLAALGELTAGIAHEIQNPLNFVNNFSDLSCELLDEFQQGLQAREHMLDPHMHKLLELIKSNCDHIRQHGRRATSIVEAMILHSHSGTSSRSSVQLNDLIDEFALLAYQGMRLQYPQFVLDLQREFDADVGKVEVLPQEMSRAIVNICNNAWEAAIAKAAENGHGENPVVTIRSKRSQQHVHIFIRDNGDGVPDDIREKMFEPFFTTKRSSRNAGLGLSLTYEIITKLHHGKLAVRSEPGQFTECEIILPVVP